MRVTLIFICIALLLLSAALAITPANPYIQSPVSIVVETYYVEVANGEYLSIIVYEKHGFIWKVHFLHEPQPVYINIHNYNIYDSKGTKIN